MNKSYLTNDKKIYCKTENKLIYELNNITFYNYEDCITLELELKLIAGWDYINPDYSNKEGFCCAEHFIEDIQYIQFQQYYLAESTVELLESEGFEILESLPIIHK